MPKYSPYYDPDTDKSPFLDSLWRVRHLCTRAEATLPHMKAPGSFAKIETIRNAIDDYAECETGHREFFWNKPHKAG
jgi:hypothetical protein